MGIGRWTNCLPVQSWATNRASFRPRWRDRTLACVQEPPRRSGGASASTDSGWTFPSVCRRCSRPVATGDLDMIERGIEEGETRISWSPTAYPWRNLKARRERCSEHFPALRPHKYPELFSVMETGGRLATNFHSAASDPILIRL